MAQVNQILFLYWNILILQRKHAKIHKMKHYWQHCFKITSQKSKSIVSIYYRIRLEFRNWTKKRYKHWQTLTEKVKIWTSKNKLCWQPFFQDTRENKITLSLPYCHDCHNKCRSVIKQTCKNSVLYCQALCF